MATIETRKTQIKAVFRNHRTILDSSVGIKPIDSRGKTYNLIYVPKRVDHGDPRQGLALKEGVGYLSITEEVNSRGERIGYVYRFTSDEYTYIADKKSGGGDWMPDNFFNFHYQKDKNHDWPHVSFLHPSIRYISRDITLDDFLNFVENTFFVNGNRKSSLPWHSHF